MTLPTEIIEPQRYETSPSDDASDSLQPASAVWRLSPVAVAYLLLAAVSLVHGSSATGWVVFGPAVTLWLRLSYDAWVVMSVLLTFGMTGHLVLDCCGELSGVRRLTKVLFACAAGSAVCASILLLLSLAGWLAWWTVSAGAIGVIVIGTWRLRSSQLVRSEPATPGGMTWQGWRRLALVVWVAPFLIQATLPVADHDSASYHLPFARSLVHEGPFQIDAEFRANNYPAIAQLFLAALHVVGAESAGTPLNLAIALAIPLSAYAMGREFWSPCAGTLAALFTLSINVLWEVAITLRVDGTLAFFTLMAVFAFLLWRRQPGCKTRLALVGCMLGMALGIKYTAVLVAVLIGAAVLACVVWDWLRGRRLAATGVTFAILFACLPSGSWYAHNFVVLGDPVYPLLLRQPLYQDAIGALRPYHADVHRLMQQQGPPAEDVARRLRQSRFAFLSEAVPNPNMGRPTTSLNLLDAQRRPWLYARKPLHWVCPLLALGLLLPLVRRDATSLWLYFITVTVFVALAGQTPLVRYVLPAFPLAAICSGVLVAELNRHLAKARYWRPEMLAIPVALLVLFLSVVNLAEWIKLTEQQAFHYLRGRVKERPWVARVKKREGDPFPEFAVRLEDQRRGADEAMTGLPNTHAHVFLIAESRGYLLDCKYSGDMSWDANRWSAEVVKAEGDLDTIATSLRAQEFSHILVNVNFLRHWSHARLRERDHQRLTWAMLYLEEFIAAHGEVVVGQGGILLVRLRRDSA